MLARIRCHCDMETEAVGRKADVDVEVVMAVGLVFERAEGDMVHVGVFRRQDDFDYVCKIPLIFRSLERSSYLDRWVGRKYVELAFPKRKKKEITYFLQWKKENTTKRQVKLSPANYRRSFYKMREEKNQPGSYLNPFGLGTPKVPNAQIFTGS